MNEPAFTARDEGTCCPGCHIVSLCGIQEGSECWCLCCYERRERPFNDTWSRHDAERMGYDAKAAAAFLASGGRRR